jgi:3-dehydroquinate synthetase
LSDLGGARYDGAKKIHQATVEGGAPIYVGSGARELLLEETEKLAPDKLFIVTDRTVEALFVEDLRESLPSATPVEVVVFNEGEANKNLANLEHVAGDLLRAGANDRSLVLNVGGGVALNMGALAASLIGRGARFAHVATTFAAAWRVTTSARQTVHFVGRRDALGVHRPPLFAIVDEDYLSEEPIRQARASLVDYARQALALGGAAYERAGAAFARLGYDEMPGLIDTLHRCIEHRLEIGRRDPEERALGEIDAYGAFEGRAIEILAEGRLLAGEAVYYGLRVAGELARELGFMNAEEARRHDALLDALRIEAPLPAHVKADRFVYQLHGNNKTLADNLPFMLLAGVGRVAGGERENDLRARVLVSDIQAAQAFERVRAAQPAGARSEG